jgi:hypothetical protein
VQLVFPPLPDAVAGAPKAALICAGVRDAQILLVPPDEPESSEELEADGAPDGSPLGSPDGRPEGNPDGRSVGRPEGNPDGRPDGNPDGRPDGLTGPWVGLVSPPAAKVADPAVLEAHPVTSAMAATATVAPIVRDTVAKVM